MEKDGATEQGFLSLPPAPVFKNVETFFEPISVSYQNSFIQNVKPSASAKLPISIQKAKLESILTLNDHLNLIDSSKTSITSADQGPDPRPLPGNGRQERRVSEGHQTIKQSGFVRSPPPFGLIENFHNPSITEKYSPQTNLENALEDDTLRRTRTINDLNTSSKSLRDPVLNKIIETTTFFPPEILVQTHRDVQNSIATKSHFKAVLLEGANKHPNNKLQSHIPAGRSKNSQITALNINNDFWQNNRHTRSRPTNRNFNSGRGNIRVINAPSNIRIMKPLQNRANGNARSPVLMPFMKPPPRRRNHPQPIPFDIRNARNRPNDMLNGQETRTHMVLANPNLRFIRTGQFNAGGHKRRDNLKLKNQVAKQLNTNMIPPASTVPTRNTMKPQPFHNFRHSLNRPQIVMNSRPPITSLPVNHQMHPNKSIRNSRHSNQFNVPHLNSVEQKFPRTRNLDKNKLTHHESSGHLIRNGHMFPTQKVKNNLAKTVSPFNNLPNRPFFERHPIQSSSHVYSSPADEHKHRDTELSGISQPLPHQILLKTSNSKMAESHVSLLKNLQFGVHGEPLDVWIPMNAADSK